MKVESRLYSKRVSEMGRLFKVTLRFWRSKPEVQTTIGLSVSGV